MIKAVIFDMNGVIVDDEHIHELAFQEVCFKYKINLTHKLYQNLCMGKTDLDGFKSIIKHFKIKAQANKMVKNKTKIYLKLIPNKIKNFPGVIKLINNLNKSYTLALASSSTKKEINMILKTLDIVKYFKVIISANDIKKGKPDPEPYLLTAKKLKTKPKDCVVIEDTKAGVMSAKNAGMMCIAITTTNSKNNLKSADFIIKKFSEVEKILERK